MSLITTPGFYPQITPEQYFAEPCSAPALTNSGIKMLLSSCPAKFAHHHPAIGQLAEDRETTRAQYVGKLVHRLALDKGEDYAISPYDEYRTKEAKAWRDDTLAAGLMPVKPADFETAQAMAATIREGIKQVTRDEPYETEVVIAWWGRANGKRFWCRAMLDVWCPALNLALDVKTCESASDAAINRAFASGYATQHAFYSGGLETLRPDHKAPRFGFLFNEKEAPHLPRYAECSEGFRHGASFQIDHACAIFADCLTRDEWPGYAPLTAHPPAWWLSQIADLELSEAA